MNRDPRLYLDDIAEAIEAIEEYTSGITYEAFSETRLVQDAVIRRVEIIGEAARRLPQQFKDSFADTPWVDIVGMRNRVTHEYFGVLLDRIWLVVQRDLPILKRQIERMREALR